MLSSHAYQAAMPFKGMYQSAILVFCSDTDFKGLCSAAHSSSWMQASAHRYVTQAADGRDAHTAAQAEAPDRSSAEHFSSSPEPPPAVLQVLQSLPLPARLLECEQIHTLWNVASNTLTTTSVGVQRLESIASSAPGLCSTSRVMVVDTEIGCLIPHLQASL